MRQTHETRRVCVSSLCNGKGGREREGLGARIRLCHLLGVLRPRGHLPHQRPFPRLVGGGTDEIVSTKALQAPAGPAGKGCVNTRLLSTALPLTAESTPVRDIDSDAAATADITQLTGGPQPPNTHT